MPDPPRSRWWYFLPVYVVCLIVAVFRGSDAVWVSSMGPVVAVAAVVLLFGYLPLAVCLFMDARAIENGDFPWNPNRYLYGVLGLSGLLATTDTSLAISDITVFDVTIGGTIPFQSVAILVPAATCVFYLFRRYRYVGFW